MREVVCGDMLRVIIGEMNRAQQMDLWRETLVIDADEQEVLGIKYELMAEQIAVISCRALEIKARGGDWARVTKPVELKLNAYETLIIDGTLTEDLLRSLPKSWVNDILAAALAENGGFQGVLFLGVLRQNNTPTNAVLPSDSTPSAAPETPEASTPMKTTGK